MDFPLYLFFVYVRPPDSTNDTDICRGYILVVNKKKITIVANIYMDICQLIVVEFLYMLVFYKWESVNLQRKMINGILNIINA